MGQRRNQRTAELQVSWYGWIISAAFKILDKLFCTACFFFCYVFKVSILWSKMLYKSLCLTISKGALPEVISEFHSGHAVKFQECLEGYFTECALWGLPCPLIILSVCFSWVWRNPDYPWWGREWFHQTAVAAIQKLGDVCVAGNEQKQDR